MPNRIIRDVGLTSKKLASVSDFGERLYWRVYQAVDDFGRFHGDPDIIRARCFPLMLDKVSARKVRVGRDELAEIGLLLLYRSGADEIVQITKFDQRVRAEKSRFASPDDCQVTVIRPSDDGLELGTTELGTTEHGSSPLTPSRTVAPSTRAAKPAAPVSNGFDQFWQAYPRKRAKGDALKAWTALKPDAPLLSRILHAVESQRESPDWQKAQGRYIPYPATWLRAQQWEDVLALSGAEPSEDEFLRRNRERIECDRKLLANEEVAKS